MTASSEGTIILCEDDDNSCQTVCFRKGFDKLISWLFENLLYSRKGRRRRRKKKKMKKIKKMTPGNGYGCKGVVRGGERSGLPRVIRWKTEEMNGYYNLLEKKSFYHWEV